MNYKKLIRSRSLRIWILSLLSWVPDRIMIPIQYYIHTGRTLNFKNPTRFTEKIQLYKLYYRDPLMLRCTDKYEVRSYIEELGLKNILVPLIGIYSIPEDIDINLLPNEFVVKTTDGGGGNQVLICHDKKTLSSETFYSTLNSWLKMPKTKPAGREWAYENKFPRKIVIEQLLHPKPSYNDLPDYKFYCFDGKPYYCQVISNRHSNETIDFYDMNWRHMPFVGLNSFVHNSTTPHVKPSKFDEMKNVAAKLSKEFPFSRIDLYDAQDGIYFGEITFYPASGYGSFTPDKWDISIGKLLRTSSFI